MNARLNNLLNRAKNPRDKNFRNHLYIFLICCGISLFIWFLIKMSDDYVAEIDVPVTFTNIPADKQLNNTGDAISIRLRANGGELFSRKYLSRRGNIEINMNQVDLKMSRYFEKYYILTSQIRNQVNNSFDFDYSLISISPDTIFLDLEKIISKSIPVKAMVDITFKPQYMLYDSIVCIPDEIMVSGPASVIDTLTHILTVSRSISRLDKTEEIMLPLAFSLEHKKVKYSDNEVKVIIPVEQFTESTIEIAVHGISDDTGISKIRTFPETVQLTYQVAIKDYTLVKPDMFLLSSTYNPEKDKEKTFLKVHIDESPGFIRITRINPDKVEFIIQK